jgi:hypothetical protein
MANISKSLAGIKNMTYHYEGYLALDEKICTSFCFKIYFTLKYICCPKNVDDDSFKGTGRKL